MAEFDLAKLMHGVSKTDTGKQQIRYIPLELIDPDETPKNVLIKGIKKTISPKQKQAFIAEYNQICNTLGIHPYLWDEYVK